MTDLQQYEALLADDLAPGFKIRELVDGTQAKQMPPSFMWQSMQRPLRLANELRTRMIERHGAHGLRCNAAYRPTGGALHSQHKKNRALDLDLLEQDYGLTRVWYVEAVTLWCELGNDEILGLGLYCPKDYCQGIRIHIDVAAFGRTHSRHWQHGYKAGTSDVILIARHLGLALPGEHGHSVDDESSPEGAS